MKNLNAFVKKSRYDSEEISLREVNGKEGKHASNASISCNQSCSFREEQIMVARGIPLHA